MMRTISFVEIDDHLLPWARQHNLPVYTKSKDEETRSVVIVDSDQNQFQMWAIPDFENHCTLVRVVAALNKCGGKKHTFYRERRNFILATSVPLDQVSAALEQIVVGGRQMARRPSQLFACLNPSELRETTSVA